MNDRALDESEVFIHVVIMRRAPKGKYKKKTHSLVISVQRWELLKMFVRENI